MISGGFFIFNKRVMDVYMMSVDSEFVDYGTNYLIAYHMLEWANRNGISVFNWESIPGRKSGAYGWKEQWGSRERVFLYLTRVLGDVSGWGDLGFERLGEAYRWHYVLPFNLLKGGGSVKFTTKDELVSFMQSLG
jgi:hypothetical protein